MDIKKRVNEILTGMNSFKKEGYHKSEYLPELMKMQDEMVSLTFSGEHADAGKLRLYDVEDHFSKLNESLGGIADNELALFSAGRKVVTGLICSEISGHYGEILLFQHLDTLRCEKRIFRNIEFGKGELRTELDALVITPKGLYILEAKNKKRDVMIDEEGNMYKIGNIQKLEQNLTDKLRMKEALLRSALAGSLFANLPVTMLVVFTNTRNTVYNNSPIKTCFPGQLRSIIEDGTKPDILSVQDMDELAVLVEDARCHECYPPDFDVRQFKLSFASLMATLEYASADERDDSIEGGVSSELKTETGSKIEGYVEKIRSVASGKYTKVAGEVIVAFALGVLLRTLSERRRSEA